MPENTAERQFYMTYSFLRIFGAWDFAPEIVIDVHIDLLSSVRWKTTQMNIKKNANKKRQEKRTPRARKLRDLPAKKDAKGGFGGPIGDVGHHG